MNFRFLILFLYTGKKPTVHELWYMEYQNENGEHVEVHVIDEVKANWIKLVGHLHLPDITVANEMAKPGWTPDSACLNVFTTWLSGEGRQPCTWATLIKALEEMTGYRDFVKNVRFTLDNQQQ